MDFPGWQIELVYSLQGLSEARDVTVKFSDGQLRVGLPAGVASEWASSERVGIEGSVETAGGAAANFG